MQSNGGRLPAEGDAPKAPSPRSIPGRRPAWSAPSARPARSGFSGPHHLRHGRHLDRRLPGAGRTAVARSESEIDGLPIRTPVLDIVSVGAGGGSIVWVDDGGMLRVGPQSAGADPGPACYGKGGTRPATPTPISSSAPSGPAPFLAAA